MMLTIDLQTARRFVLGKQGLWPGRRRRGLAGVAQAMQTMVHLQLDPLQMIARSHDLALHSRVLDYQPGLWEKVTYQQRQFFDWGGWLATRPMADLPYWRRVMHRERDGHPDCNPGIPQTGREHAEAIAEMRTLLREHGTLSNRDFKMASRKRTDSYRGRKDSAVALYHLWRTGEVMTHHRNNFERVYALTEMIAPADLIDEADDLATDTFLIKNNIAFYGLSRLRRQGVVRFSRLRPLIERLLAGSEIIEVAIEGRRAVHYALGSDAETLRDLSAGQVPATWQPLETDTTAEAVFLAPLDPVSARGRAKALFGFDYVWEVYKPAAKRKFGYYTLPVLWGDRLVARFDSKFDRTAQTFTVLGFWLEDDALAKDDAFAAALARGFVRFMSFLGASTFAPQAIAAPQLRHTASELWLAQGGVVAP